MKDVLEPKEDQYCFVVLNSNGISTSEDEMKERYNLMIRSSTGEGVNKMLKELFDKDKMNNGDKAEPGHEYFRRLFLCGKDLVTMRKWLVFINKILIEQQLIYTTMNNTQTTYKTTYENR